jgi:class 3 adenylate cyclase/HAMP domain-containing protein
MIMFISGIIIISASIYIVFNEYKSLKNELNYNSILFTKLVGNYCASALTFDDWQGCYDILLKTDDIPYMVDVIVYDTTGNEFCKFVRKEFKGVSKINKEFHKCDTTFTKNSLLNVMKSTYYDGIHTGYIHFRASYKLIQAKITNFILMMIGLLAITLILTYVLASNFQKIISKPIMNLAKFAKEISLSGDYTKKIKVKSRDEIGELYNEFHNLLNVINQRNLERAQKEDEINKMNEELEEKVNIRTLELKKAQKKTQELLNISDQLLLNILPEPIAGRLKNGEKNIADHYEDASVIFIDIVDFTKLSDKSTPQKMVTLLNDVFSTFDKLSSIYGLEKIKTIGDCYMAAAGIPIPRADHAHVISLMALDVMECMKDYKTEDGHEIKFRIGLDCGPIVAGVIGEQKFIYDLWGDMVNTASRMETHGVIGRIQCTERFKSKIESCQQQKGSISEVLFEERGEIEIKGKGKMKTFFIKKD